MIYQTTIKNLKKRINPFEDSSINISIKDVDNFLVEGKLPKNCSQSNQTFLEELRKEIIEPSNKVILLSLHNNSELKVEENIAVLAAKIYKNEIEILVEFVSVEKISKTTLTQLLGKIEVFSQAPIAKQALLNNYIDWKKAINENAKEKTEEQINADLLKKLENIISQTEELEFNKLNHIISVEKWSEKKFIKEFLKTYKENYTYDTRLLKALPEKVYAQDVFWEAISELLIGKPEEKNKILHILPDIWNSIIINIFDENNTDKTSFNKEELFTLKSKIKEIIFNKDLYNNVYISPDYPELCKIAFPYAPQEKLDDMNFIERILKLVGKGDLELDEILEYIPDQHFSDFDKTFKILRYTEHYMFDKYITEIPKVRMQWIDKFDDVKKLITKYTGLVTTLYDILPEHLKNDKGMAIEILKKYPDVYKSFPSLLTEDKEVFIEFITRTRNIVPYLNDVYKIEDKETLKKIVKNHPTIMISKTTPQHFRQDEELIAAMGSGFRYYESNLSKIGLKKLYKRKNLMKDLIKDDSYNYKYLPNDIKMDIEMAELYMESGESPDNLPNMVWHSKQFCLSALRYDHKLVYKVPAEFFEQKDFVLNLFKEIDEENIGKNIIHLLPEQIKDFLVAKNVKENYEKYLSSYFLSKQLDEELIENNTNIRKNKL